MSRNAYGPSSFWFLNHYLDKQELKRQLTELREKGFSSVYMHARAGLLTPYLSSEWYEMLHTVIEFGKEIGIGTWLYDEDPFPSGAAGGKVFMDHPEYKARSLSIHDKVVDGDSKVVMDLPYGRLIKAFAIPHDSSRQQFLDVTQHVGVIRTEWSDPQITTHWYYPPYHNEGGPHWRAETSDPHLRFMWDVPKGRWILMAFIETIPSHYYWSYYTDLLNKDAVEYFLKITHEEYEKHFSDYFGEYIPGIFNDEPKLMGPFPWTPRFPIFFAEKNGYDILDYLPCLKLDTGDLGYKVRSDYRRTLSLLFRESFFQPIYTWCERNGLKSTGHISPEEDPIMQCYIAPELMQLLEVYHVPGVDIVGPCIGDEHYPILNIGPKLASSVAHSMGKEHILAEALGANGWDLSLGQMKQTIDWLFVLGVNSITIHGQFYSIDGKRKWEAPPSQFYQSPYWDHFYWFAEYVSRLSEILGSVSHVCDILVLYPSTTFNANLPLNHERMETLRDKLGNLTYLLLSNQLDFDFCDERSIQCAELAGTCIKVGHEEYKVLVLPWVDFVDNATVKILEGISAAGIPIIILGGLPKIISATCGEPCKTIELPVWRDASAGLIEMLNDLLPDRIRLCGDAKGVFMFRGKKGNMELCFFVNTSKNEYSGAVQFPSSGIVNRYVLPQGLINQLPCEVSNAGIQLDLNICDGSSELWSFESGRDSTPLENKGCHCYEVSIDISSEWTMKAHDLNCSILKDWHVFSSSLCRKGSIEGVLAKGIYVNMLDPGHKHNPIFSSKDEWWYTKFYTYGYPTDVLLVFEESTFNSKIDLYVNCKLVYDFQEKRVYDCKNRVVDITQYLHSREGMQLNYVAVHLKESYRDNAFLEPLRLMGPFQVESPYGREYPSQLIFASDSKALDSFQSWTDLGFPYYSGRMIYTRNFEIPQLSLVKRVVLNFEDICNSARITVNNDDAGIIAWHPYAIDITQHVKSGQNTLSVEVANTAINMLEGIRQKSGLIGRVWLSVFLRNEVDGRFIDESY